VLLEIKRKLIEICQVNFFTVHVMLPVYVMAKKYEKVKIFDKLSETQYRRFWAAETHSTRQCR